MVFDLCDEVQRIEAALAPLLAGRRLGAIICAHLLEHLRRPWIAAGNLQAPLAPGGLLFVQVPWVQAFHAFPDDYWRFSLSGLMQLFDGLELVDAFWSGGSSDVACRLLSDGKPDYRPQALAAEARIFQVLLPAEVNRRLLGSLPQPRAYLSRGYLPVMVVNYLARKPGWPLPAADQGAQSRSGPS